MILVTAHWNLCHHQSNAHTAGHLAETAGQTQISPYKLPHKRRGSPEAELLDPTPSLICALVLLVLRECPWELPTTCWKPMLPWLDSSMSFPFLRFLCLVQLFSWSVFLILCPTTFRSSLALADTRQKKQIRNPFSVGIRISMTKNLCIRPGHPYATRRG